MCDRQTSQLLGDRGTKTRRAGMHPGYIPRVAGCQPRPRGRGSWGCFVLVFGGCGRQREFHLTHVALSGTGWVGMCVCMRACALARMCVRACVCVCVRARVRACL